MNTVKFTDKGEIKMIAHRGVSGLERENTCPAFVAAGVKSYYGIETDVHVTKDGKFIVFHDDNLKRLVGVDTVVEESNYDDLRKLRIKDTDGITDREDLFLPSLEEYISICRKYDKQAILELKNAMAKEKVWEIVEIIKAMAWFERTTFISFYGENLVALKEKYPTADAQFLAEKCGETEIAYMQKYGFDADLDYNILTKELVSALHEKGIKVNCWTVNTLEKASYLRDCGVDFITTNILE